MKKILKLFVFVFGLFLLITTSAFALSEDEAIKRVELTETKAIETITILTNWSSSYASSLKSLVTRNFVDKLNSLDAEVNVELIINELNSKGYAQAANALSTIKTDLLNNYEYIKESLDVLEKYLVNNSGRGVAGNLDLFIQIRQSVKNLKTPVADLVNIYYELDYSDLEQKIKEIDTADEISDLVDYAVGRLDDVDSLLSRFQDEILGWQDIYNLYYLSDYSSLFMDYFGGYYSKAKEEYNKLYLELETKLQEKLDEKIEIIVNDTDMTDNSSIMTRNTKLYDLMDYINQVSDFANSKIYEAYAFLSIDKLMEKVSNQQVRITTRFDEAISYTEQYIIDYPKLMTKIKEDEKYINIDNESGLIIYNQRELDADKFIDRLIATLGEINAIDVYSNKIGTLSMIELQYKTIVIGEYTIIVKGDIAPNAAFDITDVVKLCNKLFEKENLNEYQIIAADMNDDSKIDITDVVLLCNILFNK